MRNKDIYILKWLTRKRVLLITLFFSVVLLGVAIFWFSRENKWLELDYEKQNRLTLQEDKFDDLFLNIQSAEAAVRGFAGTGNRRFIQDFNKYIASIQTDYSDIKEARQTDGSSISQRLFLEFDRLIREKVEYMLQVKKLCQANECDVALKLLATERGIILTDSILQTNIATSSAISKVQIKSKTNFTSINNRNNNLAYAGIIASMLLIAIVFYLLVYRNQADT